MEEQPPTEPPRRRPEPKSTRGSGRTKAAFTSPPEADPEATDEAPRAPRPRSRPTPPAVLFQPPTEAEAPPSSGSAVRPPAFFSPGQGRAPTNSPEPGPQQADQPTGPAPDALETGDSTPTGQDEVASTARNGTTPPGQGPTPAARKKTAEKKVTKRTEGTGTARKVAAKATGTAKKVATAKTAATRKTPVKKAAAVSNATATPASADAAHPPPQSAATTAPGDPTTAPSDPTTPPGDPTAAPAETASGPQTTPAEPSTGPASPEPPSSGSTGTPVAGSVSPDSPAPEGTADGIGVPEGAGRQGATARHILDHPGYLPEFLALAAVRELGPGALAWAARIRTSYPTATADGLARLATRRYVRLSAVGGALSMATGLLAPFAELAVVTWAQAGLVLRLAAAHDHDPTAPDRAADLLVLTRVHPDRQSAEAALDAAEAALRGGPDGSSPRVAEAGWRLGTPIGARSANWLALRLAVRRLPGATTLVTALANSAATERLAARASTLYRTTPTGPHSAGPSALPYNQSNQLRGSSA